MFPLYIALYTVQRMEERKIVSKAAIILIIILFSSRELSCFEDLIVVPTKTEITYVESLCTL